MEGMLGMVQVWDAQVRMSPQIFIFFCAAPKVFVPPLLPMVVLSRESMMVGEGLAGTDAQRGHQVAVAGHSAAFWLYGRHVDWLRAVACFASLWIDL